MSTVTFGTLKFVESLKAHNFTEEQAKGLSEAFKEAQDSSLQDLATKDDLKGLKQDLKSDINELKYELKLHRWMLGILIAGVISLVMKAFFV